MKNKFAETHVNNVCRYAIDKEFDAIYGEKREILNTCKVMTPEEFRKRYRVTKVVR